MTIAHDIVHYFKVVNHILVHHNHKTSKEIADELFLPELLVWKIYQELHISLTDSKIKESRKQSRIERPKREDPFSVPLAECKPRIEFVRPPALYSNKSPYGIADDLHNNPNKYGTVGEEPKNKFGKLNKKYLTSAL
jgi:hypothetical protein